MKNQIRWNGGEMLTTIQGIEGCSVDCSREFDIIAAYGPDGVESTELLHSINEDEAERIRGECIEWTEGRWI